MRGADTQTLEEGEVLSRLGIPGRALERLIHTKRFPPPFMVSNRRMWTELDVFCWTYLASRLGEPPYLGRLADENFEEKTENSCYPLAIFFRPRIMDPWLTRRSWQTDGLARLQCRDLGRLALASALRNSSVSLRLGGIRFEDAPAVKVSA